MRVSTTSSIGALALVTLLALACASCQAIERESKRSEAYAQMQRGELALDQERYEDAHAAFGRAYEILKAI
ncbi:MAG: hypothetical protein JRF63_13025, partial [Deltaproteobacteria bacterium]|nr:hypothetical protein [Deltaproteobacteria bacterium]